MDAINKHYVAQVCGVLEIEQQQICPRIFRDKWVRRGRTSNIWNTGAAE